jgi:hypothetical protein
MRISVYNPSIIRSKLIYNQIFKLWGGIFVQGRGSKKINNNSCEKRQMGARWRFYSTGRGAKNQQEFLSIYRAGNHSPQIDSRPVDGRRRAAPETIRVRRVARLQRLPRESGLPAQAGAIHVTP